MTIALTRPQYWVIALGLQYLDYILTLSCTKILCVSVLSIRVILLRYSASRLAMQKVHYTVSSSSNNNGWMALV